VDAKNVRVLLGQSDGNANRTGQPFFDRTTDDLTEEPFSGMTNQHRMTCRAERLDICQQRQVMPCGFAESNTGVDDDPLGDDDSQALLSFLRSL